MKKILIVVVLLIMSMAEVKSASSASLERILVDDYVQVPNMEYSFEIKSKKYDKIILDCQSFITGMNFYKNNKLIHSFYLDAYGDCTDMQNFISDSRYGEQPVCLEIESDSKTLTVSNQADCQ